MEQKLVLARFKPTGRSDDIRSGTGRSDTVPSQKVSTLRITVIINSYDSGLYRKRWVAQAGWLG